MSTTDPDPDDIDAQAIAWTVRINDPAFDQWEAFGDWLEASPAHHAAYQAAAAAEAEIVAALKTGARPDVVRPTVIQPEIEQGPRWRRWAGGLVAASIVAALGVGILRPGAAPVVYETAAGVHRTVTLADGSSVALNGGTRLLADAGDPRSLRLERGEALFTVRHDASRPFKVAVGDANVVDVGTTFDIVREGGSTEVAVAEGAVVWNPKREAVHLGPGRRLRTDDGASRIELSAVQPAVVGGWTTGQLSYDGEPLETVAADLSRTLGILVTAEASAKARPVRGVIRLDGGADVVVPRLGALVDIRARREGDGWRLSPPP